MPSAGDGTSCVALSVSNSNSGSPERTAVAILLQPARQDALGDRLADGRHLELNGHHFSPEPPLAA